MNLNIQSIIKICASYIDRAIGTGLLAYKLGRQTQGVRPGPALSHKLQASSTKLLELQAASFKPQAASFKLKATSRKLPDP